ncbi:MAG: hypothetical protein V1776_05725 [Candidatus Diapherotrites archaeon]
MRGFFSALVALLGILLLISLFYTQSARNDSYSHAEESLVVQQLVYRDWFLSRNAYVNFASDAIFEQVADEVSYPSCNFTNDDFTNVVNQYWSDVYSHMKAHFGVDCYATLPVGIIVKDDIPVEATLTCYRKIGEVDMNITHPFIFRKDVEVVDVLGTCKTTIFDTHGIASGIVEDVKNS